MEHVEWFVKPGAEHTFNAEAAAEHYEPEEMKEALAKGVGRVTEEALARGRPPKNWMEIPRENSRSKERAYGTHPSMKPLKLCDRLVRVHSHAGAAVLIPFGGSGSECISSALAGRHVLAFEVADEYYQLMLRRAVGWGLLPKDLLPAAPPAISDAEAAGDGPPLVRDGRRARKPSAEDPITSLWRRPDAGPALLTAPPACLRAQLLFRLSRGLQDRTALGRQGAATPSAFLTPPTAPRAPPSSLV
jgi:hypothetical protein